MGWSSHILGKLHPEVHESSLCAWPSGLNVCEGSLSWRATTLGHKI